MTVNAAWIALGACAAVALPGTVCADGSRDQDRPMALGFNIDLLPTVLSAANGKLGYAPQVWVGIGHARIRFVGAHLEPPNAFAFAPKGFHDPTTTAFASIIDYTFGSRFDGVWIGSGFEVWQNSIEHDEVAGMARWTSIVLTIGGGYIWRFAGDFFLDPWAGVHVVLNPQTISLGAFDFKPFPLQGEVSMKVGWFLPI